MFNIGVVSKHEFKKRYVETLFSKNLIGNKKFEEPVCKEIRHSVLLS